MKQSARRLALVLHSEGRSFDYIVQSVFAKDYKATRDDVAKLIQDQRWKHYKSSGRK